MAMDDPPAVIFGSVDGRHAEGHRCRFAGATHPGPELSCARHVETLPAHLRYSAECCHEVEAPCALARAIILERLGQERAGRGYGRETTNACLWP